ncbi:MAG: asparagine synthase (glutamine-hydrolyzing) [Chitinophagaceae bacterium]|nr:asparagine synthase (glutamine-hydrolyzing) [Chitinophagaceae bacterium]
MCGIAGILSLKQQPVAVEQLRQMTVSLAHRGPDGEGSWLNESNTVALGHRRLSIIDLSDAASQPFHYNSRYTVIHNGEIYNYIELREELRKKGYAFSSESDTEVIAAAYDCYKEQCVQHFDGMFAFAIWDEKEKQLFAARDRFGEKPFYYCTYNDQLLFASEIKALWAAGVPKEWNHMMLLSFLANGHTQNATDASLTFYKNIFCIPPGHYASWSQHNSELFVNLYWDLDKQPAIKISEADAIEQLRTLLTISVQRRLRSDVTVGTSLSGGLDSSSVVAISNPFHTSTASHKVFTAVFPGFEKDEARYSKLVADQFQLQQFTVEPTAESFINDFQKLCYHQEQPFNSSSVYAQYKVMELAKQNNVTVLLDGQGADETLAGYSKYVHWYLQEQLAKFRYRFTTQERILFQQNKLPFKWGVANYVAAWFPVVASAQLEDKERKRMLMHPHISREYAHEYYDKYYSVYKPPVSKLNDILYFNTMQQGLGELLHYADRNSMAHGREVRLPFLSHELVEFIFSLPSTLKMYFGFTKYILRKTMDKELPGEIVWRTEKVGYEPPQKKWMENSALQEMLLESRKKLVAEKILDEDVMRIPLQAKTAYEADNFDWKYLTAAHLM